jgi:hypothetical protein
MRLRHSLLQTSAVWCNLEATCYQTDYQTCGIILPGAPYASARSSDAFRASVYSKGTIGRLQQKLAPNLGIDFKN